MRNKILMAGLLSLFCLICLGLKPVTAEAGEVDVLVETLVEKGYLTPMEARIIKEETKQQVADELAAGKSYALPQWVQKLKVKGDLRLRYQYERRDSDTQGRERGRLRYRLGVESKVTDEVTVGAGLASGGDDPRSTNQTFQNTFDTPDIRLDYAFAEYTPNSNVSVIGGKFKRKAYLWAPTDLLWDGDINPEGGSIHLQNDLTKNTKGFVNSGVWVLDERDQSADNTNPFMVYAQGGVKWKDGGFDATAAGTYYNFNGVQGGTLENGAGSNATTGGVLTYDYDSIGASAEFGVKEPLGVEFLERVAVFGDYIHNFDPSDDDNGWAAGLKFGNKSVKKKGSWQGKYIFAHLAQDAWLDTFPDSDRFGGATDVQSHEAAFKYALADNLFLGIDYYYSDRILRASNPEHLVQSDLEFKF